MAKIEAIECDACDHFDTPEPGRGVPTGWLLVEIHREIGDDKNEWESKAYCSWSCLADVARYRAEEEQS